MHLRTCCFFCISLALFGSTVSACCAAISSRRRCSFSASACYNHTRTVWVCESNTLWHVIPWVQCKFLSQQTSQTSNVKISNTMRRVCCRQEVLSIYFPTVSEVRYVKFLHLSRWNSVYTKTMSMVSVRQEAEIGIIERDYGFSLFPNWISSESIT